MTWHYATPERLATHLAYDRDFIAWMGARGLNAFSWIRHAVDSRLKIHELAPALRERGIAAEYGGHVLQLLLPRDRFEQHPEYFPVDAEGNRNPCGNLCVSNSDALSIVRAGALSYLRDNPECVLLHVWGADVWDGAWCRCAECAGLSPQLQYMKVVNAIADALASVPDAPSIAYLAYHDTIEPDPALRPRTNVAFEWAPRERCYSHAIDDHRCEVNPRYLESLKRYFELFDGRGHVFEYYADAILFGGIAVATPAVIARDLRAYRALGLTSMSCLTFGMHSALAYPVNLEAFARATRSPDFGPARVLADTVARIHPRCAREMAPAYRAIARASSLILDGGGELMPPNRLAASTPARRRNLARAIGCIDRALAAADHIGAASHSSMAAAEREVWHYSREVVSGIAEYLAATTASGTERGRRSEAAIASIGGALHRLRDHAPGVHDTWAAWDLEWITDRWLKALRSRFDQV
jgi:hypothetical protein